MRLARQQAATDKIEPKFWYMCTRVFDLGFSASTPTRFAPWVFFSMLASTASLIRSHEVGQRRMTWCCWAQPLPALAYILFDLVRVSRGYMTTRVL